MNTRHISLGCTLILFNLLAISCDAQDRSKMVDKKSTSTSPSKQIAEHIFDIHEDKNGNLWFGTYQKGLAKYDGKSLTYLTEKDGLCGNSVANIAEDEEGNLWFGTHMDLCKYEVQDKDMQTLPRKDGQPILGWGWKNMGAGWKSVRTNKDGSIWVNSHHGIFRCNDPQLTINNLSFTEFIVPMDTAVKGSRCDTPGKISLDLQDSKGNLWFGTDGDGVYKFNGQTFTHFSKKDGLPTNNVTDIAEDAQGNIWFACVQSLVPNRLSDGGVCKFDGEKFTTFSDREGLSRNDVFSLYADKSGNVWIGANGVGVYRYNASRESSDNEVFALFKQPKEVNLKDGFNTPGLQSMLEDSKGNFWFGYSGGLFRLQGTSIVNVTVDGPW